MRGHKTLRPLLISGLCCVQACGVSGQTQRPGQGGEPFLNFRGATLRYHGLEESAIKRDGIPIGWFGPPGGTNELAADMWCAASLAVEEANALELPDPEGQPSVERAPALPKFRLVPRWAADRWGTGVSQLARMIYEEQPLALLGSIDSAATHLAEQIVAKANLPLISPVATDKTVTLAGVPWMFSCAPCDTAIARLMVQALPQNRVTRFALLSTTDHESRMTARELRRELSRRQRLPEFDLALSPGRTDSSEVLRQLAEADLDSVIIIAAAADTARLLQSLDQLLGGGSDGRRPLIIGGPAMARNLFREMAGSLADRVHFPILYQPTGSDPRREDFERRFVAQRQHPPDYVAFLTYDATRMLLQAVCESGPHRAALRDRLAQPGPWEGLYGTVRFDGTGQNTSTNIQWGTWRSGRVQALGWELQPSEIRRIYPCHE